MPRNKRGSLIELQRKAIFRRKARLRINYKESAAHTVTTQYSVRQAHRIGPPPKAIVRYSEREEEGYTQQLYANFITAKERVSRAYARQSTRIQKEKKREKHCVTGLELLGGRSLAPYVSRDDRLHPTAGEASVSNAAEKQLTPVLGESATAAREFCLLFTTNRRPRRVQYRLLQYDPIPASA